MKNLTKIVKKPKYTYGQVLFRLLIAFSSFIAVAFMVLTVDPDMSMDEAMTSQNVILLSMVPGFIAGYQLMADYIGINR